MLQGILQLHQIRTVCTVAHSPYQFILYQAEIILPSTLTSLTVTAIKHHLVSNITLYFTTLIWLEPIFVRVPCSAAAVLCTGSTVHVFFTDFWVKRNVSSNWVQVNLMSWRLGST